MSDDATVVIVQIDGLAPGGDAVGRQQGGDHAGRATFVALAAPGERIRARLIRQKARVAWAELVEIQTPSPDRVPPPCPYFGSCGGCQWQHVGLAAQRAAKQAIVERALAGPAAAGAPKMSAAAAVRMIVPVESGRGYRDRARLIAGANGALGFRARRSHAVVDVERCLLLAPELEAPLAAIRASMSNGVPAHTELDVQLGNDGVHVSLRVPPLAGSAVAAVDGGRLFAAWRAAGIVGVRIVGRGVGRGVGFGEPRSFGAADVDVSEAAAPPLRIPAGGFAQVGRAGNAALIAAVLQQVGAAPGAVLELYAGSGNFTRHLVRRSARVVAADAEADAVARGRRQVPAATWLVRPPADVDVDADTVLVDPPREGLDPENLAAALSARRRIVYVSCDPQTLGRDAARLARAGFVLGRAVALDLMPHTFHVEVVATFDKGEPNQGATEGRTTGD